MFLLLSHWLLQKVDMVYVSLFRC